MVRKINNKAMELSMNAIVIFIILLVALIVFLVVFPKLLSKGATTTYGHISCSGDSDGDGITDVFDQCCNSPAGSQVDVVGCLKGEAKKECECKKKK